MYICVCGFCLNKYISIATSPLPQTKIPDFTHRDKHGGDGIMVNQQFRVVLVCGSIGVHVCVCVCVERERERLVDLVI